jgi:hypothetical protein
MKHKRALILPAVALTTLCGAFIQDEFLIRRELKDGAVDTYKVTTKVVQVMTPSDPSQAAAMGGERRFEISMTMDLATTLKKIAEDKKSADFEMSFDHIVYDFGDMAGMLPQDTLPKALKASGKMDDRSRFLEMKMPELPSAFGSSSMAGPLMVELPEKAIKVGDSWDMPLPTAKMLGATEGKITAKLIGLENFENIPAYRIELASKLPIDADLGEMAQASGAPPMKILAKGTFTMKGNAFVDRATGKTLRMQVTFDTASHVNMPEVGVEFDTTGNGTSLVQMVLPK